MLIWVQVQLDVNSNTYQVRFVPETQPVNAVARNFCISQAESLGYTPQNPLTDANLAACVNPIAAYLQRSIPQKPAAPSGDLYAVMRIYMSQSEFIYLYRSTFLSTEIPLKSVSDLTANLWQPSQQISVFNKQKIWGTLLKIHSQETIFLVVLSQLVSSSSRL